MIRTLLSLAPVLGLLAACQQSGLSTPFGGGERMLESEVVRSHEDGPPGAEPGTCWGRDVTPALVETVTEQVILPPPAADASGAVRASPVYRTDTRQRILREREEIWFRTPCDGDMTPEMIETLQRALSARSHYKGPITGRMDAATRRAVRAFQRPQGLDSGLLSLTAARQLGLVAFDFSQEG
jgi:hypothetical protein